MRLLLAFVSLGLAGCQSDTFVGSDGGDGGDAASDAAADSATCPDESGDYSVTFSGQGCASVAAATACITETSCSINIGSGLPVVSDAGGLGISGGPIPLDASGGFGNAVITEEGSNRNGCTGAWNPSTSVLTITCGGDSGSQSCIATLKRSGSVCPN